MPAIPDKPKIVFSVTNCICFDQRVLKIAETVSKLNCDITIVGRHLGDCCDETVIPFRTRRFRMIFRKGFLFYKFINLRLFFYLLFNKFDILVANDLDTLLPNYLVSKLKRLPLIYDSHEYFTGVPEIQGRPFVKWVWTTFEKMIFPRLRYVLTVSESIAEQYYSQYGIRPVVVRNSARSSVNIQPFSRAELGVPPDNLLLILQGGGINIDRGAEELIEAIASIEKVFLFIAGSGDIIGILKEKAIALNVFDRIRFIPKKPWNELMRYTRSADAGLSLDKDTNPNYHFSLPNKLFDYISAGIPVIAGNLPEVKSIIEENYCGILIPAITPEEIASSVTKLRDDRILLNNLRLNAVSASESLNWNHESRVVNEFYLKILKQ